jgi:hypothetical protein
MKEILFFEGNHETIILPENLPKVKMFYTELYQLFSQKGYRYRNIETCSSEQLKESVSLETCYLVGHSQGATRILEQFSSELYPQIKGIILFDPQQYVQDSWNLLKIPKLLFVNTKEEWHDYTNFQDKIEIDDDHYFTKTTKKVFPLLRKFILQK